MIASPDSGGSIDPEKREKILEDVKSRIQPLTSTSMFLQAFNLNPFVNLNSSNDAKLCLCGEQGDQSSHAFPIPLNTSPILPRFEPVVWQQPKTAKERLKYEIFYMTTFHQITSIIYDSIVI